MTCCKHCGVPIEHCPGTLHPCNGWVHATLMHVCETDYGTRAQPAAAPLTPVVGDVCYCGDGGVTGPHPYHGAARP